MLEFDVKERFNIDQINNNLYNIKSKSDFEKEFSFVKG